MHDSWALRKLQFLTLYRVFLLRVVDLELLSTDGDPTRLIGQFATIFTTISFFFTLSGDSDPYGRWLLRQ